MSCNISQRWTIGICFLIGVAACWTGTAQARGNTTIYEIKDTISVDALAKYAPVVARFAQDIPGEKIKFLDLGMIFIRLEDERVCLHEACLTILISRCDRNDCPIATAFVGSRFRTSWVGARFGQAFHFLKRSGESTSLVSNGRFIAAYQGL